MLNSCSWSVEPCSLRLQFNVPHPQSPKNKSSYTIALWYNTKTLLRQKGYWFRFSKKLLPIYGINCKHGC